MRVYNKLKSETFDIFSKESALFDGLVQNDLLEIREQNYQTLIIKNCQLTGLIISNVQAELLIIENCRVNGTIDMDMIEIGEINVRSNVASEINIGVGVDLKGLNIENNGCSLNFRSESDSYLKVSLSSHQKLDKTYYLDTSVFKKALGS
jgi:hypothetical protein